MPSNPEKASSEEGRVEEDKKRKQERSKHESHRSREEQDRESKRRAAPRRTKSSDSQTSLSKSGKSAHSKTSSSRRHHRNSKDRHRSRNGPAAAPGAVREGQRNDDDSVSLDGSMDTDDSEFIVDPQEIQDQRSKRKARRSSRAATPGAVSSSGRDRGSRKASRDSERRGSSNGSSSSRNRSRERKSSRSSGDRSRSSKRRTNAPASAPGAVLSSGRDRARSKGSRSRASNSTVSTENPPAPLGAPQRGQNLAPPIGAVSSEAIGLGVSHGFENETEVKYTPGQDGEAAPVAAFAIEEDQGRDERLREIEELNTRMQAQNDEMKRQMTEMQQRLQNQEEGGRDEESAAEKDKKKENQSSKRKCWILICVILFILAVGGAVAAVLLLGGSSEPTPAQTIDSSSAPSQEALPSSSPTVRDTPGPTEAPKGGDSAFDPPKADDCAAIARGEPVVGQDSMMLEEFEIEMDAVMESETDMMVLLPDLERDFQDIIAPQLSGCVVQRRLRSLQSFDYGIGNAIGSFAYHQGASCAPGTTGPCYRLVLTLELYLRGDIPQLTLLETISNVVIEGPFVQKLNLPPPYSVVVFGQVRQSVSQSPSDTPTAPEDTIAPTPVVSHGQSTGPSFTPVVESSAAPTGLASATPSAGPSLVPTPGPSLVPTPGPSERPTTTPVSDPTPPPTPEPTPAPTPNPTPWPTRRPSSIPSFAPTTTPSTSPSMNPSWKPSIGPSNVPSSTPTIDWNPVVPVAPGKVWNKSGVSVFTTSCLRSHQCPSLSNWCSFPLNDTFVSYTDHTQLILNPVEDFHPTDNAVWKIEGEEVDVGRGGDGATTIECFDDPLRGGFQVDLTGTGYSFTGASFVTVRGWSPDLRVKEDGVELGVLNFGGSTHQYPVQSNSAIFLTPGSTLLEVVCGGWDAGCQSDLYVTRD